MFWEVPVTRLVKSIAVVDAADAEEARRNCEAGVIVEERSSEVVHVVEIGEPQR